eukprot:m.54563 g.54563  ORF g.54563 m.54563 type:complete len:394 (-) comp13632_c0_seq1:190-1371(-)
MDSLLPLFEGPAESHSSSEDEIWHYGSDVWSHQPGHTSPLSETNNKLHGFDGPGEMKSMDILDYPGELMPHPTPLPSQVNAAALQQPEPKHAKRKADPMLHTYYPNPAKSSPCPSNLGQPVRHQNPPGSANAAGATAELAPPNTLCPPFEESALAAAQKAGLNPEGTLGQFLTSITEEERRLIESEGVAVPLTGTLSANQNKELKRMRRKVKNKLSAKDSRRRRKEYLTQLEQENAELKAQLEAARRAQHNTASSHRTGTSSAGKTCAVVMLMLALSSSKNQSASLPDQTAVSCGSDPVKTNCESMTILDESAPVATTSEMLSTGLKQVVGLSQLGLEWLPSRLRHVSSTAPGSYALSMQDKLMLEQNIALDNGMPLGKRARVMDAVVLQANK